MTNQLDRDFGENGFVERVARFALGWDEHGAADVRQEVWLSEARRWPEGQEAPRGWRVWMARNRVRNRVKAAARRSTHEATWASSQAATSGPPEQLLERGEVEREVLQAVAHLGEPYRTVVQLRYYEALPPAAIAARLGRPIRRVRAHLEQAQARLRQRLRHVASGRESAFGAALKELATRGQTATAGALMVAGGVGSVWTKLFAAAAAAALAGLGFWWWQQAEPAREMAEISETVALASAAASDVAGERAEREDVGVADGAEGGVTVSGRCVDVAGKPLASVEIFQDDASTTAPLAVSGTDGRFEFRWTIPDLEPSFRTRRSGFVRHDFDARQCAELADIGDFVLRPAAIVRGYLLDVDGSPLPGEQVKLVGDAPINGRIPEASCGTITDSDGAFLLDECPPGWRHLIAIAKDEASFITWSDELGLVAGANDPVELRARLPETHRWLRVRVAEPGTFMDYFDRFVVDVSRVGGRFKPLSEGLLLYPADERGCISVPVRGDELVTLTVRDPFGRVAVARDLHPAAEPYELDFGAQPLRHVVVRSSIDGTRFVDSWCKIVMCETADLEAQEVLQPSVRDEYGNCVFALPAHSFLIRVVGPNHLVAEIGPFEDPRSAPEPIEVTVTPAPTIRGIVFADGKPRAGVSIYVCFPSEDRRGGIGRIGGRFVTAADGSFAVTGIAEGLERRFIIRAEAEGFAPAESSPLDLGLSHAHDLVELHLSQGGTILGNISLLEGGYFAGYRVFTTACAVGDGWGTEALIDESGNFRLEHVRPGCCWLTVRQPIAGNVGRGQLFPLELECTVEEGGVTPVEWILRGLPTNGVSGRFQIQSEQLTEVGAFLVATPPKFPDSFAKLTPQEAIAELYGESSPLYSDYIAPERRLSPEGAYELCVDESATDETLAVLLVFNVKRDIKPRSWRSMHLVAPVQLLPNRSPLNFEVPTASIVGRVEGAGEPEPIYLLWHGPHGSIVPMSTLTEGDTYSFPIAPAGTVLIQRGNGPVLTRTVVAGVENRIDLP